ncbi:MAG: hydroxyacid-oxoacid transhydrogenase [Gaiellales bacterium]|nr:hydroxyacid-oxoacid transhydrogenase [Gaiellales bacterium]
MSARERVFTVAGTPLVFGPGAALETGWHLRNAGVTRALALTDPHLAAIGLPDAVLEAIRAAGVEVELFAGCGVEPSEPSVMRAVEVAREGGFDGFVGLGGGSSIDSAKIAALLSTHPGGIYDYLNPPIGLGTPVPGPLLPLFGVPTTGGTGAEATTVAIIDLPDHHVKSGISHAHLRPLLGIVDPDLTLTTPPAVTASVGLDVLCHAIESYTAIAYDTRPRASSPDRRPPYQGANPVSDVWSEQAIRLAGGALLRAVADGADRAARRDMALAASAAGRAFGQAGVHIPHACSYPVAGLKHAWKPPGYPGQDRFVPHGFAVVVTAPAAFRFTEPAAPERHRRVAELLTGRPVEHGDRDALPRAFEQLMRDTGAPARLSELGYGDGDIAALAEGALKQQRLLVCSPREVGAADLEAILRASL